MPDVKVPLKTLKSWAKRLEKPSNKRGPNLGLVAEVHKEINRRAHEYKKHQVLPAPADNRERGVITDKKGRYL